MSMAFIARLDEQSRKLDEQAKLIKELQERIAWLEQTFKESRTLTVKRNMNA